MCDERQRAKGREGGRKADGKKEKKQDEGEWELKGGRRRQSGAMLIGAAPELRDRRVVRVSYRCPLSEPL